MITLSDNETGALLGRISEAQLTLLQEQLVEESTEDRDYYITAPTVDLIEANGGDPALVRLLRDALGTRDGMEIHWEPDTPAAE